MISRLHHIEFGARNPERLIAKLTHQFGFSPYAHRLAAGLNQIVLTAGNDLFIIVTEMNDEKLKAFETLSPPAFAPGMTADALIPCIDSVYNVAFEVDDIAEMSKRLLDNREIAPTIQSGAVSDDDGIVRYVTVKSCIGDVRHTLLDKSDYKGPFLPTYAKIELPPFNYPKSRLADLYTRIDHIAFGLQINQSGDVMKWYNDVLNCRRIMANKKDGVDTGLVVMAGETGLRFRAIEVQECKPKFAFVLCEPVINEDDKDGATNNQKLFLEHHHGPGVHHVAFCASDIVRTISRLEEANVVFVPNPPETYYDDMINSFGKHGKTLFVPEMKAHGILIDPEKVDIVDVILTPLENQERFLLQKFCRPIIEDTGETVFFEFLERRGGARMFGEGNVTALWTALVRQLEKENIGKEVAVEVADKEEGE